MRATCAFGPRTIYGTRIIHCRARPRRSGICRSIHGPHPEERAQHASRRMAAYARVRGHPSRLALLAPQDEEIYLLHTATVAAPFTTDHLFLSTLTIW